MRRLCHYGGRLPATSRYYVVLAPFLLVVYLLYVSYLSGTINNDGSRYPQQQQPLGLGQGLADEAEDNTVHAGLDKCHCKQDCRRCFRNENREGRARSNVEAVNGDIADGANAVGLESDDGLGDGVGAEAVLTTQGSVPKALGACRSERMLVNNEYTRSVYVCPSKRGNPANPQTQSQRLADGDVLWPFSFVKDYCDIPGAVELQTSGQVTFEHSRGRLYHPTVERPYTPQGPYMNFENSSVEARGQLKCIDGVEAVPRSQRDDKTQGQSYFYPTQIAQYGLRHYSRLKADGGDAKQVLVLDDGSGASRQHWKAAPGVLTYRSGRMSFKISAFKMTDIANTPGVVLEKSLKSPTKYHPNVLVLKMRFLAPTVVSIRLRVQYHQKHTMEPRAYTLRYYTGAVLPDTKAPLHCGPNSKDMLYLLGPEGDGGSSEARLIVRDLAVDSTKGIAVCKGLSGKGKNKLKDVISAVKVQAITLHGAGEVFQLHLNRSAHEYMFLRAADWFMKHYDAKAGGWPVPVKREMSKGLSALQPGWMSAMALGQVMSLLIRAYHHTRRTEYVRTALKATAPFHRLGKDGGVKALFMGKVPWYEEYPTEPSIFVLNGFMFSLIGLYDLFKVAAYVRGEEDAADAQELFNEGFKSLHTLLPLYDSGAGSMYDLRHFTLSRAPNAARAEYHVTHLNQLATFCSLFPEDATICEVHKRWLGYHQGHHVPRN